MSLVHERILGEISSERDRQEGLWGTTFDDKNAINDWVSYITIYAGKAAQAKPHHDPNEQRVNLLKVATLAVAALGAYDRNGGFPPRHYDVKM